MKHRSRSKKRIEGNGVGRLFPFIGRVMFVLVLIGAAVFAVTIFFRVEKVSVEGLDKYTADQITSGMDVKIGDNLYLFNKFEIRDTLLRRFPYLETVQIRRKLPDTLTVTVTECEALAAVPSGGGYFLVSGKGKVLEQRADDGGFPLITGASLLGCRPGDSIDPANDAYSDALITVLNTLESAGMLEDIDFINIQSLTDVRIGIMGRFDIRVGTVDSLAYRLRFARYVISERLSPSDVGRISWDAKGRLHFVPDTVDNVRNSGLGSAENGTGSEPLDEQPDTPDETETNENNGDTDPDVSEDAGTDAETGDGGSYDEDEDVSYGEEGTDDGGGADYSEDGEHDEEYYEDDENAGYEDEEDYSTDEG